MCIKYGEYLKTSIEHIYTILKKLQISSRKSPGSNNSLEPEDELNSSTGEPNNPWYPDPWYGPRFRNLSVPEEGDCWAFSPLSLCPIVGATSRRSHRPSVRPPPPGRTALASTHAQPQRCNSQQQPIPSGRQRTHHEVIQGRNSHHPRPIDKGAPATSKGNRR